MFSSLKIKNFRLYWIGMLVSLVGTWLQSVAQSWLVFQLTGSSFLLGLVGFLSSIPVFIFSLFAGVIVDRTNKKTILIFTQNAFMILAFLLAILTQTRVITPGHIMLIAGLNGLIMAFDAPARQAMVVELVGKPQLMNAIALNSAAFNSARILGPALAGILIAAIGMYGCFYLNAVSFLAVILALFAIKIKPVAVNPARGHFLAELVEGLRFIRNNRIVLILISMVAATSLFGVSYVVLMPIFATTVLMVGSAGFGILMSASGLGALVAALMLAQLGDFRRKGRLLVVSALVFSFSLVLFSCSRVFMLSLLSLASIGWSSVTAISLINTILQTLTPDRFRGRVMSAFMFTFAGVLPFGNLLAGSLGHLAGVSFAVMSGGIICAVFFTAVNLFYPEVRRL